MKKIQTVLCTEETWSQPCSTEIIGSYATLACAIDVCVCNIIKKIESRRNMAYALFHDQDHPEMREAILKVCSEDEAKVYFERSDEACVMPDKVKDVVMKLVGEELKGRCYFMCVEDGEQEEFHFEIIENELEEAW